MAKIFKIYFLFFINFFLVTHLFADEKPPFELTIIPDKKIYRVGDDINVKYKIVNHSDQTLGFYYLDCFKANINIIDPKKKKQYLANQEKLRQILGYLPSEGGWVDITYFSLKSQETFEGEIHVASIGSGPVFAYKRIPLDPSNDELKEKGKGAYYRHREYKIEEVEYYNGFYIKNDYKEYLTINDGFGDYIISMTIQTDNDNSYSQNALCMKYEEMVKKLNKEVKEGIVLPEQAEIRWQKIHREKDFCQESKETASQWEGWIGPATATIRVAE